MAIGGSCAGESEPDFCDQRERGRDRLLRCTKPRNTRVRHPLKKLIIALNSSPASSVTGTSLWSVKSIFS